MENKKNNPWVSIWVRPKETLRELLAAASPSNLFWIPIIFALIYGLFRFVVLSVIPEEPLTLPRVLFNLISSLVVIVYLYIGAWAFRLVGSWLGGVGNFIGVKYAVGWSFYPFILVSLLSLLHATHLPLWFHIVISSINLVLLVWGIVIKANLLGEAHKFSAWKGLVTLAIPAIFFILLASLVVILVPLISPLFK